VAQQVDHEDSDAEPSVGVKALEANLDLKDAAHNHCTQNGTINVKRPLNDKDPTNLVCSHESPLSMGEIISSLDAGVALPGSGPEYSADRHSTKSNETQPHVKRSNIWGRSNVSEQLPFVVFPCRLMLILLKSFMIIDFKCFDFKSSYGFIRETITRNTL
jgi:hypothetical protein